MKKKVKMNHACRQIVLLLLMGGFISSQTGNPYLSAEQLLLVREKADSSAVKFEREYNNHRRSDSQVFPIIDNKMPVLFTSRYYGGNVGSGTFSLYDSSGNLLERDISSGTKQDLAVNQAYIVKINKQNFKDNHINLKHHHWNDWSGRITGVKNTFFHFSSSRVEEAVFRPYYKIGFDFTDSDGVLLEPIRRIQLRDPWYIETVDGEEVQNNQFHDVTIAEVFLSEGGVPPELTPPYYSLLAPQEYVLGDQHYQFSHWQSDPVGSVTFIEPESYITDVVFNSPDANVKAVYMAESLPGILTDKISPININTKD